jgi:ribose-phosphate pyrophosphokinase
MPVPSGGVRADRRAGVRDILADDKFKIFCGTANPALAKAICNYVGVPLGQAEHGKFSDGETRFQILENVRGADVFVVQPCSSPVDFNLMQLLIMIDAFKRASAWRITAVIPYYPYARQDRKDRPRVAISAKLVADLLETAGSSRVLTLDLHAPQIQGYFNIPVDHLFASPVLVEYFQKKNLGPMTIVSPDAGGVERARYFAKKIDAPLAIVDKRRIDVNVSEVMHLIGDVAGRPALVIDDIIDTAGTLVKTAEALLDHGATKVYAACTHPVLSGPAVERIANSKIEEVVVADSVPLTEEARKLGKIKALSVASLLARGIQSIHEETSISELFT